MADNKNVGVGKPLVGGAIYRADTETATLPTTAVAQTTGFTSVGYISEEGVTNTPTSSSDTISAWGGDVVESSESEFVDEFSFIMIESLNTDAMKAYFGSDNVSGTLTTGITVKMNAKELETRAWIIDTISKGYIRRIVIPAGKITSREPITYNDEDLVGYGVTIMAKPDANGNTHYEYIAKKTTS